MTRSGTLRIPIATVAGETVYREVDLTAGGNDPLMTWLFAAKDWDITDFHWDEKRSQPRSLTYRGGTFWDAGVSGEVTLVTSIGRPASYVRIEAPLRENLRGSVTVRDWTWTARAGKPDRSRVRGNEMNGNLAVQAITTGSNNVVVGHNALKNRCIVGGIVGGTQFMCPTCGTGMIGTRPIYTDALIINCPNCGYAENEKVEADNEISADPYRTAGDPGDTIGPGPETMLFTDVVGLTVIDADFKDTVDSAIGWVLEVLRTHKRM